MVLIQEIAAGSFLVGEKWNGTGPNRLYTNDISRLRRLLTAAAVLFRIDIDFSLLLLTDKVRALCQLSGSLLDPQLVV